MNDPGKNEGADAPFEARKMEGYLYIEPTAEASPTPVIDSLTRKMAAALEVGVRPPLRDRWRGIHHCACGASSTNYDLRLPNGKITNTLAVHYLAWHRKEIPATELARIANLPWGESDPTEAMLSDPSSPENRENRRLIETLRMQVKRNPKAPLPVEEMAEEMIAFTVKRIVNRIGP